MSAKPGSERASASHLTALRNRVFRPENATMLLLLSKPWFVAWVPRLRRMDLSATLQLLIVLAIGLPLLPKEPIDPWGVLPPRKIGLFVTLIAGISYVGYVLNREALIYTVRYRHYEPMLGRFMETVPLGYPDGCRMSRQAAQAATCDATSERVAFDLIG